MAYWLLKTEPDEYSIDDLAKVDSFCWDEIRNYQARNLIRDQIKTGDFAFIYHSSCKQVGIAGIVEIISDGEIEQAQFNPEHAKFDPKATQEKPKWYSFQLKFKQKFNRIIPLSWIKQQPELEDMVLCKQGRLSVQPVTQPQWQFIIARAK
ncbi:EVE domain-containing protein [Catenovulum sp. 2E275]|uniref:EVE domain-containing protein n=1 Tax=Catenovulum sp. 2E275 TaxID=2980497 RepID=UPI0021CE09A2|nr:EVE domain-containing protein [Catenovulum sp. 2E275]MCU4675756.1 EVE domain-containing protein [Catenovulum sp. 2E275]